MIPELSIEQLYNACDPALLPASSRENRSPLETIIGQNRGRGANRGWVLIYMKRIEN
jgi:hypothetical protein